MPDGAQQPRRRPRSKPKLDPAFCRFRLSAHESAIHRYGVFAQEPIPAGRKVIEYTGERITDEQGWRRRFRKHVYLFSLQSGDLIDGAVGGSGAEFINHSCEPNVVAREVGGRIWYSSLRRIEPGEELTVDYRLDSDEEYECICGAPSCRGKLNAPKDSPAT